MAESNFEIRLHAADGKNLAFDVRRINPSLACPPGECDLPETFSALGKVDPGGCKSRGDRPGISTKIEDTVDESEPRLAVSRANPKFCQMSVEKARAPHPSIVAARESLKLQVRTKEVAEAVDSKF